LDALRSPQESHPLQADASESAVDELELRKMAANCDHMRFATANPATKHMQMVIIS
jgi:hypothetical protein